MKSSLWRVFMNGLNVSGKDGPASKTITEPTGLQLYEPRKTLKEWRIFWQTIVSEGTILNAVRYVNILNRLLQGIRRVRPEYAAQGSWILLHDNARPQGVVTINYLLCSPDLSFLFRRLKSALKGQRLTDISEITVELKDISKEAYSRSFQDLYSRSQKCISINGDFFKRQQLCTTLNSK